ncbi:hypothetical protein C922_03081 [Plasmodium inui San Antonio 1]|uniref:Surface-related antigen SRA n=1 Tax=Plasmodium inui San Antonio 1 TaxID=1237626 RepID=W6ZZT9_9APIC|nr:hypothetical protein C922_03081 [Plasmodium inui San Antonio 1]EUD66447.1 hypothetical protein C922_03081 [Plasmodium inui San Antonio 1]
MFCTIKKRAFTFIFLSYASFVYSDKTDSIGNALAGGLSGGLSGGLPGGLTGGLTSGLRSLSSHVAPAAAPVGTARGPNMHTCHAAGCKSYKNITPSDPEGCLYGFICKECKKTHAKNSNICFYSSLQGYENLYEAYLEDFTNNKPYDNFTVPVINSNKGEQNGKDASSDKETTSSDASGSDKKSSRSQGEEDDEEKGEPQHRDKGDKAGGSRYEEESDEEGEQEEEQEEEEDDDDTDAKGKRGENKGDNSSNEKNKGGDNSHAEDETKSFLQKGSNQVYSKVELHQLVKKGGREQPSESKPRKGKDAFPTSLETDVQLGINEGGYNRRTFEPPNRSTSAERSHPNDYSFAESKEEKEKIVYKRLKISLNKYEEYFKNKLNKCDVGKDGMATFYVKVLLQIVQDKNEIYVDVSRGRASSHMGPVSNGQKGNAGKKTNGRGESGEDEEDEEDADESDEDESMRASNARKGGGGDNYSSDAETGSDSEGGGSTGFAGVNKYAYVEVHGGEADRGEANRGEANRGEANLASAESQSFYQVKEDLDGDAMGNYYKTGNGFFKSIFRRVFRRRGDSDEDGGGENEDGDEESQGKKRRWWRSPWNRRRGNNKQLQGGDDDGNESEDISSSSQRTSGKKRRLFGRSSRDDQGDESSDDNEDFDDEESSGRSGAGKGKGHGNHNGKAKKGGRFAGIKSKTGNLFTKVKRKIMPIKQKIHMEAFFNSIIVKSCRNPLKWNGKMFQKKSLVEMTLKIPVKMKYIKKEPLHFFRSGYEVILTCSNCEEILFNSCVQVYCTKRASKSEQAVGHHSGHVAGGALGNAASGAAPAAAPTPGALAAGALAAGALATGASASGSVAAGSPYLYSENASDFAPLAMFDYNDQYFPGSVNSEEDDKSSEGHMYVSYSVILVTLMAVLFL